MTLSVLIVDDSPEDCQVYRRLLDRQSHGEYEVSETDSGEAGLELCRSQPPDCILLDYNLPDLDGIEFLTELAESVGENQIAVVMLTGHGNESIAVEAMKKGADTANLCEFTSRPATVRPQTWSPASSYWR